MSFIRIEEFLSKMVIIQNAFLNLIETEDDKENNFQILFNLLNNELNNKSDLKLFLHLLLKISQNHHRQIDFFSIIERIITFLKKDIEEFSQSEIFRIFKGNKRILLFLIKSNMLNIDKYNYNKMKIKDYLDYFKPEIDEFCNNKNHDEFENNYEEMRQNGENESIISNFIRNDSVEEFITYVNRINLSLLRTTINHSIFETNSYLLNKNPTLIEYAAFYGSIQIFQYLLKNNVELSPSVWIYAIHGKNAEIIHLLEENNVHPKNDSYIKCFEEAIKCHHNDIATYIKENLMSIEEQQSCDFLSLYLKYYNFSFIDKDSINHSYFYDLCKYDYVTLVKYLLADGDLNINKII